MPWVIDSCVLLDVALKDEKWGEASARLLERKLAEGLVVCPVSEVEITPTFGGELEKVREFLTILGAADHTPWLDADTRAAARAWTGYVAARRKKQTEKRPVADILIGAFAQRFGKLVTRNPDHFLRWFPGLEIVDPAGH